MSYKARLDDFNLTKPISLLPCPGWPKTAVHFFDREQAIAVLAAKGINRPLLVRGEPGCGKTQLARAAAQVLAMPLACLVVNERTETEDLFWRYDALRRLSDANVRNKGVADEKEYLSAGPLWWAFNRTSAEKYEGKHGTKPYVGDAHENSRNFANGVLLLIDEIDKADRSVPNSLLEALGNYSFQVPYINERVQCPVGMEPLIIITTNEEQELPPAFVRRCLVLDLVLPDNEPEFVEKLATKGRALLGTQLPSDTVYEEVARMLWEKRREAKTNGSRFIPGQAEYFDHLEAIKAMLLFDEKTNVESAMTELSILTYGKSAKR